MKLIAAFGFPLSVKLALLLGGCAFLKAQDAPHFSGIQRLTNQETLLQWSGTSGPTYRLEISPNLVNWTPWLTLLSTGLNQNIDAASPYYTARHYRALRLEGTNDLAGDHLLTEDGLATIHPINHASLVLSWKGLTIFIDPVGGAARYRHLPRADVILVTHEHSDHFDSATLNAVKGSNTVILATRNVYNGMNTTLKSVSAVLTNGARANLLGLEIEAVPAYNLTASNHPRGAGNGYVLTLGGKRFYIAGDTENIPEMQALASIEVAFLPMNIPYTMDANKAAGAVREFKPRIVYPYHYRNQNSTYADLNAFKRLVGHDLGIEVRLRKWY